MCTVSDKLRLCTCTTADPENLKHYWVFYRYDGSRNEDIVGEIMLPVMLSFEVQAYNNATLERLLNEAGTFDIELHPKRKDRLMLAFTFPNQMDRVYYGFHYSGRKWIPLEYSFLEWYRQHEEAAFGKITGALKR